MRYDMTRLSADGINRQGICMAVALLVLLVLFAGSANAGSNFNVNNKAPGTQWCVYKGFTLEKIEGSRSRCPIKAKATVCVAPDSLGRCGNSFGLANDKHTICIKKKVKGEIVCSPACKVYGGSLQVPAGSSSRTQPCPKRAIRLEFCEGRAE